MLWDGDELCHHSSQLGWSLLIVVLGVSRHGRPVVAMFVHHVGDKLHLRGSKSEGLLCLKLGFILFSYFYSFLLLHVLHHVLLWGDLGHYIVGVK